MKKITYLIVTALGLFNLNAGAQSTAVLKAVEFPEAANFTSLSSNGEWATAKGVDDENSSMNAYPYLVNISTGELTKLWSNGQDYIGAWDVTDDGQVIIGDFNNMPAIYNIGSGEWTELYTDLNISYGTARSVTADGKYIAGYGSTGVFGSDNYTELPLLWEKQSDGTYKFIDVYDELQGFPTKDRNGNSCTMTRIDMLSDDGNIMCGAMNYIYPGGGLCYYVYNKSSHDYKYVDSGLPNDKSFIDAAVMSNNGKFITGISYIIEDSGNEYSSSCLYDVENNKLTVYDDLSEEKDRGGNFVSNTGIVFGASPAVSPARTLYYRVGNYWYGLDEVLSYKYGINFYDVLNYSYTGYTVGISDDEKTMIGMSSSKTYGYIVKLPETFSEAAKGINLLKTYIVEPTSGSVFAKFKEATITFSKETDLNTGFNASLYDENNNLVNTYQISKSSSGNKYAIGGIPYQLSDGKKYTLTIPAGTFSIKGDASMVNEEISVTYIGRENVPVEVEQISPSDGTKVSEISSSNPVQIRFDIDVAIADDAKAYLYQEGSESPISELIVNSSNSIVTLYPSVKRYLMNGTNYTVKLPAGMVTDIMGYCANEEMSINYQGAYEQQINVEQGTLFSDDFNDVSNSLVRYLLYEGDHNVPSKEMQSLYFDKDNTPWNFTIRESESSSDYCVASTSMYTPAGKSDDWMSIPQLYIENSDYYLEFDSQSYRNAKNDTLKVYVLVDDNVYESFTKSLYDKFMSEGELIYNEKQVPGSSEDNLSGDWKHNSIRLEKYSGKNIYIAFVNQNEDQSMIFIDNVKVAYKGDFLIGISTPNSVVAQDDVEIKGFIKITGDKTYNDLKLTCVNADGNYSDTFEASGLGLNSSSANYLFSFSKKMPLTKGQENTYRISADLDGTQYSVQGKVNNLTFEPVKRVVIEEGTGTWCSNCPNGFLAIEHLEELYPGQIIAVGAHNGDSFAYEDYVQFLGITAFPSGRINRIDTIYSPVTYVNEKPSFTSESGNETFTDIVNREMEEPTYSDVSIESAVYDANRNMFEVKTKLKYALDMQSLNQNLCYVIVENKLPEYQSNNLYLQTDPFYGEWGKGGQYGSANAFYIFNDVARKFVSSFNGIGGSVPSYAKADEEISYTVSQSAPGNVTNWDNAEVVCMLLDANTGKIVNAVKSSFTKGSVGINDINGGDNLVQVYNDDNNVYAMFCDASDAKIEIYDMSGKLVYLISGNYVANESVCIDASGFSGIYIIRVVTDDNTYIKKLSIK